MSESSFEISELYSAYAAGRLSPAFALLVETQANLRSDIARDVTHAEMVSGAFLERERCEVLAPNAFEQALQAIDQLEETADRVQSTRLASDGIDELMSLPEPLREKALEACLRGGWRRLTSSVSRIEISRNLVDQAHLYRIRPGGSVPRHAHHGNELTLVLQGGFSDETGSFGPGDTALKTPADIHQPVADDDGTCLVFAVTEGGMKFTGLLGMVQKIFS